MDSHLLLVTRFHGQHSSGTFSNQSRQEECQQPTNRDSVTILWDSNHSSCLLLPIFRSSISFVAVNFQVTHSGRYPEDDLQ